MKRTAVIAFVIIHVVTAALTSCAVPGRYPNVGISLHDVRAESSGSKAEQPVKIVRVDRIDAETLESLTY